MSSSNLRTLFDEVIALPAAQRPAWIQAQQIEESERDALRALLRATQTDDSWIARSRESIQDMIQTSTQPAIASTLSPNSHIGTYQLIEVIGEGGMASVYRAERSDGQFKQTVAIKVLRQQIASELEERWFKREQQALAGLDHPNVAKLFDGGVLDGKQPYLVMEWVKGLTLLKHCEEKKLSLRARVELFAKVCDGVQAAHRALIVHRDIKPANIIVNDQGEPKLLDFGVAKLLTDEETTNTFAPLTPAYAAPEQFDGRTITTSTDVYSLGMVLHELLTGIRRSVNDTTRASEVAKRGSSTSMDTARFLQGDLDNILRHAMHSEPSERYASAGDLANDLRSFLTGQPVSAHPPSRWYRTWKFVKRNRTSVAAIALLSLGLVASLFYAIHQRNLALVQAARAISESKLAQQNAKRASAVQAFLVEAFESTKPSADRKTETTMLEFTEAAITKLALDRSLDPEVRADLQATLGLVLSGQGKQVESIAMLQAAMRDASALDQNGPSRVKLTTALTQLLAQRDGYQESIDLLLPLTHLNLQVADWLLVWTQLAYAYARLPNEALATKFASEAVSNCATACSRSERLMALGSLGEVQVTFNRNQQAVETFRALLIENEQEFGKLSVETAAVLSQLARALRRTGKLDDALLLQQRVLAIDDALLPRLHFRRSVHLNMLGNILVERGQLAEAETALAEALHITETLSPDESSALGSDIQNVAMVQFRRGKLAEGARQLKRALTIAERQDGARSPRTALIRCSYIHAIAMLGELQSARAQMPECLADLRKGGAQSTIPLLNNLIRESQQRLWMEQQGDPLEPLVEAEQILQRAGENLPAREREKNQLQRAVVLVASGKIELARALVVALSTSEIAKLPASANAVEISVLVGRLAAHDQQLQSAKIALIKAGEGLAFQQPQPYPYLAEQLDQLRVEIGKLERL